MADSSKDPFNRITNPDGTPMRDNGECESHRQSLSTPTEVPPEGYVPAGISANDI